MQANGNVQPTDQALAERPAEYSDPELAALTDKKMQDILEETIAFMPIVLPCVAALMIFMLAFIAVNMT